MIRIVQFGLGVAMALLSVLANSRSPAIAEVPGAAEVRRTGETMTLRDAISRAIGANPRLQGYRYMLEGADARKERAGFRPPWEVGVDLENFAGTGGVRSIDDIEATLRLGTVIELADKRERRIDVARTERDVILTEQAGERLDILAEVARRLISVASFQEFLLVAERQEELSLRALEAAKTRVAAARAPATEVTRAEIALMQAGLAKDDVEHDLETARISLASTWNDRTASFGKVVTSGFYDLKVPVPLNSLADRIDNNPELVRFASEARLLDARARLAEIQSSPDYTVSGGIRRLQADNGQALVFSLSMPLGSAARSSVAAREARAAIGAASAKENAARSELHRTLFAFYNELRHAREIVLALRNEVSPKARQTLAEMEQGFRAGRYSLLDLTDARRQLLEIERSIVESSSDYHRLSVEIERLTGHSLGIEGRAQ